MKTLKLILVIFLLIAVHIAKAQEKKDICNNLEKSVHKLGGIASEGNLQVLIYDNANMQVNRYLSDVWVKQWYGASSKSIWLYADGATYSGDGSYFVGAANLLTKKSCYNIDANTNELSLEKNGTIEIKQITNYPEGSTLIYYTWEIKNTSSNIINDLRFFSGGDTYLYGDDYGSGQFNSNENTVMVSKTIEGNIQSIDMKGVTIPYAFESKDYYSVYQHVISNALTDSIDENETTDNGMALEYRIQSLAPGASWIIYAFEKFNGNNIQKIKVNAPSSNLIAPDSTINLNFLLQNCSSSPTIVDLSATIDITDWTTSIVSPVSPYYLPANSTQIVTIYVTCPAGTAIGTNAKVILNATNENITVSDSCTLTAAAAPNIIVNPYNINICANTTATFEVVASNANIYQWQEYDSIWNNLNDNVSYLGTHSPTLNISEANSGMNNYKYRCLVSNAFGNTFSSEATLTIFAAPSIDSQPSSMSVCEYENVNFTIAASGTAINYQWLVNDGTGFKNIINNNIYSGANSNILTIQNTTNTMNGFEYECLVNGICNPIATSETATLNVYITPNVSLGNDTILNENETLLLDAGPGTNYIWTNPQLHGRIVAIDASIVGLGVHVVGVTVTNENNCIDSDSIEITFTIFTGNNEIIQPSIISIYPNPTSDIVTIDFPSKINEAIIEIYTLQGKLLKKELLKQVISTQIDLYDFEKGAYMIKIVANHQLSINKLIVE